MITLPTHPSTQRRLRVFLPLLFAAAMAVSATGAAEQSAAPPPGKKLYESKCLRCHKDLDPTIYEDMTWKKWLWKMKDKARLDNEEYGDLSDYLKGVREAAKSKKQK